MPITTRCGCRSLPHADGAKHILLYVIPYKRASVRLGPIRFNQGFGRTAVGTATFTFSDGNNGTFAYTVDLGDGVNKANQTKAITRQVFRHRAPFASSACVRFRKGRRTAVGRELQMSVRLWLLCAAPSSATIGPPSNARKLAGSRRLFPHQPAAAVGAIDRFKLAS